MNIKFKINSITVKTTELIDGNLAVIEKSIEINPGVYYSIAKIDNFELTSDIYFESGDVAYGISKDLFTTVPQEIRPVGQKPCGCGR